MFDDPSTPEPAAGDAPAGAAAPRGPWAWLRRQLHVVERLAGKAKAMAQSLMDDWNAPQRRPGSNARPIDLKSVVGAHHRVSRAVRLALLLKDRLLAELKRRKREEDPRRVLREAGLFGLPCSPADAMQPTLHSLYKEPPDVWRTMTPQDRPRPLPQERPEPAAVDPLRAYVMAAPVEALIEEICHLLWLPLDWIRQAEEGWERQEAAGPGVAVDPLPIQAPPFGSPSPPCALPPCALPGLRGASP